MEHLLDFARSLWSAVDPGSELRLVGGLAVRLHVGTTARITRDVDVVAMTGEAARSITEFLRQSGFVVGGTTPWQRAVRPDAAHVIVDLLRHPLVDPRTFQAATLQEPPLVVQIAGTSLHVASVQDLVRLKLLAARDQDLVDLIALASHAAISGHALAMAAEADDAERALSAGAAAARHALASGELAAAATEVLGRPPDAGGLAALEALLHALQKEGI